ncbi:MAG: aminotransferase class III-fold pyridoxal phosphate-dependent enzyme [Bdellovibrionales bacterium]|nr:aminotransferase class III-fold pyridoxal phosphate-dependent enzyme [Bdellovibrionales bacterium]
MKMQWVTSGDDAHSKARLAIYAAGDLMPNEKKPYLTALRRSAGPFLAVETAPDKVSGIFDAASQIATLGLGFNPNAFFGAGQHLESWLNLADSERVQEIRRAFWRLLSRKLGWDRSFLFFCHSGAEANELALGAAFERRVNPGARKVLAFEGSFHGRLLVSLSATWSPPKREPFELPGFQAVYAPMPEMDHSEMDQPIPEGWQALWADAPATGFEQLLAGSPALAAARRKGDALLESEISCLLKVREKLLSHEIFAVIIEPMQCEGGDRYSSARFHHALANMARSFRVPFIYDEVQTGFRLGRKFFWHLQFQLKDGNGGRLYPDYVTCAKKAQVGVVVSHEQLPFVEHFSVASMARGYAHGFVLDQFRDDVQKIEKMVEKELKALVKRRASILQKPRMCGLAFSFEFKDSKQLDQFVAKRFSEGLMYYPAGTHTARFRMNLACGPDEIKAMFKRIDILVQEVEKPSGLASKPAAHDLAADDPSGRYEFHEILADWKLREVLQGELPSKKELQEALDRLAARTLQGPLSKLTLKILDARAFGRLKKQVATLERRNYEPTRQTEIEKFEAGLKDRSCIALGLMDGQKLAGLAFGSALKCFPYERGVRADRHFHDPRAIYMLDTTVDKKFQGAGLGRLMKSAVTLISFQHGVDRIQGRNRTRVARSMLDINWGFGAYEQRYIREDYADEEKYRDVVYYTCPLRWKRPPLSLSNGMLSPLGVDDLDPAFMRMALPYMVNKLTLSNFVSEDFMRTLLDFSRLLPKDMRHMYTASGLSECVDKVTKSLWQYRKPAHRMISFSGCFFGHGSFMSRGLSGREPFFPVDILPYPTLQNMDQVLGQVRDQLRQGQHLAVWIEPLKMLSMERAPRKFLVALKKLCNELNVALVYNETASQLHRFQLDTYFASNDTELQPDISYAYVGGQMAVIWCTEKVFIKTPLTMISTWDGDEYALLAYMQAVKKFVADAESYKRRVQEFEAKVRSELSRVSGLECFLENGTGWFRGAAPESVARYFEKDREGKRYLICPSPSAIHAFLKETR